MKWQAKDIDLYLQSTEYVDTAIIPLVPVSWSKQDVKSTVAMGEFIAILTMAIEHQFQGRVVQFPQFTYLKNESDEERLKRLREWEKELHEGGMKYIFYLTADSNWKQAEAQLDGSLIWLPSVPLEHLDAVYKSQIIEEQVKQMIPLLINEWQKK